MVLVSKFAFVPDMRSLDNYAFKKEHAKVNAILKRNDITHTDLLDIFPKNMAPKFYWVAKDDPHPNEKANAIIANALLRLITEEKK